MQRILRLEAAIQRYDWGSHTFLAALRGQPVPSAEPEAELWLGAHPNGPAQVVTPDGARVPFGAWVERDPRGVLGDAVYARFGARLPFLFKMLAVARALSLQAHPDAEQARVGFERESRAGVVPGARLYADPHAKPELVVAHTPFLALCGFRSLAEIRAGFERMDLGDVAPPEQASEGEWLRAFFARWFAVDAAPGRSDRLERAFKAATRSAARDESAQLMTRLAAQHPGDPAIIAPLLLHAVELAPGEALFLDAGALHCHIEGAAAEIMASSDNVLRAGLTTKRCATDELLRIGCFASRAPRILRAQRRAPGLAVFETPANEFELSVVDATNGVAIGGARGVEVLLCHAGSVRIAPIAGGEALALARGESVVVPAAVGDYSLAGAGSLYRAAVPLERLQGASGRSDEGLC